MTVKNPIQYTSRTFLTILNDINSDTELVDKPNWWKRIWAGVGDMLSMYENAIANQAFSRTAFTRQAVADLLRLIDYELTPHGTSSGTIIYYLDSATSFPLSVALLDLVAQSEGSLAVSSKKFSGRIAKNVTASSETFTTNFAVDNNLDVARVYTTGEKVRVSTTNTLPGGLLINTDYYVIKISATEIRLALSVADAYAGTEITLTSDGTGTHTVTMFSFTDTSYQQVTLENPVDLGNSDGVTAWQTFNLSDLWVLKDTITLTINALVWTRVDSFIDSSSTDQHFRLIYKSDGESYVLFGDGTYGKIPGVFSVNANYGYGGGLDSNISTLNKINVYAGSNASILGASNATTFTGGSNEENIETAKIIAPMLLKARNRFVTVDDGEYLALNYSGVAMVKVNPNVYGLLSAQVVIVPDGGGTPSGALKTALQNYLIARTILDSIDVRVIDPTYVPVSVTATVKIFSGYVFADVKDFVVLACRLLFSETTTELLELYIDEGIISAVTYINNKWSTSFDASDYTQIIRLLDNVDATEFGKDFQESDVSSYIDVYVNGVDYWIITLPAFPVSIDDDEISQDNINPTLITEIP